MINYVTKQAEFRDLPTTMTYRWTPDGRALVWMEKGRVYVFDTVSLEKVELGPATAAISYGSLEIIVDDTLE